MPEENESTASAETKPTVLVYPGLEFGETPKSVTRYKKVLGQLGRRFDVRVQSLRWKTEESLEDKKTRIREEISQAAQESNHPVGVLGVSASGPLIIEATRGIPTNEVGALATIASPLDPRGAQFKTLPDSMQTKLARQSPRFVEFADQLMRDGMPQLTDEEVHRMLNLYGKRDRSVPPEYSGLDGADNRQFWTPAMPGKTAILTHAYNIYHGLKSSQLAEFLNEKLKGEK